MALPDAEAGADGDSLLLETLGVVDGAMVAGESVGDLSLSYVLTATGTRKTRPVLIQDREP